MLWNFNISFISISLYFGRLVAILNWYAVGFFIISINESSSIDLWKDTLIKNGLDLICVATHYSNRYQNSDNYLNTKADEELKNYAYSMFYYETRVKKCTYLRFLSSYG